MAKTICKILGVVFILVGVMGFVVPDLLGTHLSPMHNAIHIISGAAALYFGFAGSLRGARLFCLAFGPVYLLLGLVGFLGPGGAHSMANMPNANDANLLKVLPGNLELGIMDHILHILLGILFLIGGLLTKADVVRATD